MREYLKASGLIAFFDGVGTDTEFKSLIVRLANEAVDAMKERGRVAPIYFTEDAGKFTVEPRHVQRLCDAFLSGSLTQNLRVFWPVIR